MAHKRSCDFCSKFADVLSSVIFGHFRHFAIIQKKRKENMKCTDNFVDLSAKFEDFYKHESKPEDTNWTRFSRYHSRRGHERDFTGNGLLAVSGVYAFPCAAIIPPHIPFRRSRTASKTPKPSWTSVQRTGWSGWRYKTESCVAFLCWTWCL